MSEKPTIKRTLTLLRRGKTDWARIDALTDKEIETSIRSDPDAAPILDEEWFRAAHLVRPKDKLPVRIWLDRDVLKWFKAQGIDYGSWMNAALREHMIAHRKIRKPTARPLHHKGSPSGGVRRAAKRR